MKYSDVAGYKLNTYFDAKPAVTGFAYEFIISELAPSTIGYDLTGEEVKPILEKNNKTYTNITYYYNIFRSKQYIFCDNR